MWDIDKRPSNNAIKPNMLIINKEARKVCLFEGTICAPVLKKRKRTAKKSFLRRKVIRTFKIWIRNKSN